MPMVRGQLHAADSDQTRGTKPRRKVGNKDFSAFASRIVRAYGRRVAAGDVEALPDLVAFSREVDHAIAQAVLGLRASGCTWQEIAGHLGVSKHAVSARWGKQVPSGDQPWLPTLNGAGEQP